MSTDRFDSVARAFTAVSRRSLVSALAGGLLALAGLERGADSAIEAAKKTRQQSEQKPCPEARRCKQKCCAKGRSCQGGICKRRPRPEPGITRVRPNLHTLAADGPELAAFARGVAAMKRRPASDPTSWQFQAGIHANRCQHGDIHFLSWHRMYVYWFERILRKASGDPSFALPYWNYSDAGQRVLPLPFRTSGNVLYVKRSSTVNGGEEPDPELDFIFDTSDAFATTKFAQSGSGTSFGGGSDRRGQIEQAPHNHVHNWVGGFMRSVQDAAKDPVFWIHHANIDRLWEEWLRLGGSRANPTSGAFLTTTYRFYNENGARVEMTGRQILDTVDQLGYRYDDQPEAAARSAAPAAASSSTAATRGETTTVGEKAVAGDVTLGPRPVEIAIPVRKAAGATFAAAKKSVNGRAALTLEGVAGGGVEGVTYEVHVGAAGANPSPRDRSFVGAIGLFGLQPWDHPGHEQHTANMSFDVTKAIAATKDDASIKVTLVPATFSGSARLPGGTWATIERLVVTVAGAAVNETQRQANPKRKRQPKDSDKPAAKRPARDDQAKPAAKDRTDRRDGQPGADNKQKPRANQKRKQKRNSPDQRSPAAGSDNAATVPGMKHTTFSLEPGDRATGTGAKDHSH